MDVPRLSLDLFADSYAVDGGSTDGTVEYLKEKGIRVYKQPKPTLNYACNYAFELCKTDALIFYHPKGAIPPTDVVHFQKYFDEGYQFIVGSRMLKNGRNEEDDHFLKPRKWFVLCLGLFAAILWHREGNVVWDTLHGFRGATVDAFRRMQVSDSGVSVDIEMVIRSYKLRIPRIEFPIREVPRHYGETHFKALPTGSKLLRFIVKEIFCPPKLDL